jgi:membrane-bound ClpP family serine protease
VTTIAIILAAVFLDGVVRIVVIGALALFEVVEITFWWRMRKKRSIVGAEAMVGTKGRALSDCRPDGQVFVKGQRWKANCIEGVDAGEDVVVTALHGLRLDVAPATSARPQPGIGDRPASGG